MLPGIRPWLLAGVQVVTAIIRRDSDGKLLLVKRSDQVMCEHEDRSQPARSTAAAAAAGRWSPSGRGLCLVCSWQRGIMRSGGQGEGLVSSSTFRLETVIANQEYAEGIVRVRVQLPRTCHRSRG